MALFVFHNSIYDKKSNTEQECLMTSNDKKAPITFIQKQEGIKPTPVLVVPEYYGKQNSTHRFQFWFDRDNPSFQLYPKQKYALKSFPKRDFHFIPYIKEIKRSVQLIMKIKDSYDNNISLDNKDIFIKSYNTIQVDKDYAFRYGNNHLHIICKVNPILIEISDEVKSAINENKNRLFGYIENTQQNMVTVNQEIVKDSEIINVNSIDNNFDNAKLDIDGRSEDITTDDLYKIYPLLKDIVVPNDYNINGIIKCYLLVNMINYMDIILFIVVVIINI